MKAFTGLCYLAAVRLLVFDLNFFPDTAFAAEHRAHASRQADSPSKEASPSAPESTPQSQTAQSVKTPFRSGSWNIYLYGGAALGKTSHRVYTGNIGLGYHVVDDFSLNIEAGGYFIDHARDTGGGGLDTLLRWHPLRGRGWSLYLDGGPGFIYTRHTLRDPGTHFNFTVQDGMGATYKLTGRLHFMAGMRWFHISNARIRGKSRNVGFDSPMFYFGAMMVPR